jgi:hypothetical protein
MKADETTGNVTRINRRQAMKAGLGGAAAAAALSVPNIEHFSLAPDLASASSQCAPGSTVNGPTLTHNSVANFLANCWGQAGGFNACANWTSSTLTMPVASGNYTSPTFTFTFGGQVANTNGTAAFTMANFTVNKPYSSCLVSFTGSGCHGGISNGTFTMDNGIGINNTVSSNGTTSGRMYCNGAITAAGTVQVAITCTCGPN